MFDAGLLVFTSNFVVQCLALERIINAGPFILHLPKIEELETRDERREKEREKGKYEEEDEENEDEDEDEDVIAIQKQKARRKRTEKGVSSSSKSKKGSVTKTKRGRRRNSIDDEVDVDDDEEDDDMDVSVILEMYNEPVQITNSKQKKSATKKRRKSEGKSARRLTKDQRGKREKERILGEDVGYEDMKQFMREFEDFFPNKDGAIVLTRN